MQIHNTEVTAAIDPVALSDGRLTRLFAALAADAAWTEEGPTDVQAAYLAMKRRATASPHYEPGLEGFRAYLRDTFGPAWYLADHRDDTDPAGPWNVSQASYDLAEARFRQLHGPIWTGRDDSSMREGDGCAILLARNVRAGDQVRRRESSPADDGFFWEVQRVRLTSDTSLEIFCDHAAEGTVGFSVDLESEVEAVRD